MQQLGLHNSVSATRNATPVESIAFGLGNLKQYSLRKANVDHDDKSNMAMELDFGDTDNVWKSGDTPVTDDDDAITKVRDTTGNGHHWSAAGSGLVWRDGDASGGDTFTPTNPAGSAVGCMESPGTGSARLVADSANLFNCPCTVVVVFCLLDVNAGNGINIVDGHTTSAGSRFLFHKDGGNTPVADALDVLHPGGSGGDAGPANPWAADTDPHLAVITAFHRNTTMMIDGGPRWTLRAGSPAANMQASISTIFSNPAGSGGLANAQIALLRVYDGVLDYSTIRELNIDLMLRYNIAETFDADSITGWWNLWDGSTNNKANPGTGDVNIIQNNPVVADEFVQFDMYKSQQMSAPSDSSFAFSAPYSFGFQSFFGDMMKGHIGFAHAETDYGSPTNFYCGFQGGELVDTAFSGAGMLLTWNATNKYNALITHLVPSVYDDNHPREGLILLPHSIYTVGVTVHSSGEVSMWIQGPNLLLTEFSTHANHTGFQKLYDGDSWGDPPDDAATPAGTPGSIAARIMFGGRSIGGTNSSFTTGGSRNCFIMPGATLNDRAMRFFAAGGKFEECVGTSPTYSAP